MKKKKMKAEIKLLFLFFEEWQNFKQRMFSVLLGTFNIYARKLEQKELCVQWNWNENAAKLEHKLI